MLVYLFDIRRWELILPKQKDDNDEDDLDSSDLHKVAMLWSCFRCNDYIATANFLFGCTFSYVEQHTNQIAASEDSFSSPRDVWDDPHRPTKGKIWRYLFKRIWHHCVDSTWQMRHIISERRRCVLQQEHSERLYRFQELMTDIFLEKVIACNFFSIGGFTPDDLSCY